MGPIWSKFITVAKLVDAISVMAPRISLRHSAIDSQEPALFVLVQGNQSRAQFQRETSPDLFVLVTVSLNFTKRYRLRRFID